MKYEVIDKEVSVPTPRTGEAGKLYEDLVVLMLKQPNKKIVAAFDSIQQGMRTQHKLIDWASEDGFTLHASLVKGTCKREMYLANEPDAEEEGADVKA